VTSALRRIELPRAIRRAVFPGVLGDVLRSVDGLLDSIQSIPLVDEVIAQAARLDPPVLRSLDAIHLASALVAAPGGALPVLCGYDLRLQQAGRDRGLLAIAPR
jgi:uncharacterized protein